MKAMLLEQPGMPLSGNNKYFTLLLGNIPY